MQKPMRIVISAYGCEPNAGSEPGLGWQMATQAVRHGNEVHVITRANYRPRIEAALTRQPVANLHFHYVDLPAIVRRAKKATGYYGVLWYYYVWQVAVGFVAARLHRKHHFDLAHHVSLTNDWMPSGLLVLPIPFIWGAVGGSTHYLPRQIELQLPAYAKRHEFARWCVQKVMGNLDPFVLLTRARASRILVYSTEALEGIPRKYRSKTRSIIHIGISKSDLVQPSTDVPQDGELRVIMGGRLVHW
jgi:hypothetical protein